MQKLLKIKHDLLCEKCQKSRYFNGKNLCWWKVYEVFHVCIYALILTLKIASKAQDYKEDLTYDTIITNILNAIICLLEM